MQHPALLHAGILFPNAIVIFAQEKHTDNREGGQTLAQVAQRVCGDSILGDIQSPAGHSPGQPAEGDPAWPGSMDQAISWGPCQPQSYCDSENSGLTQSTATKSDIGNGTEKMVAL